MNDIELLSNHLKKTRKERGLTLFQVSEKTDISISFLSEIERGVANPSLDTLVKLAECYQITVPELFIESEAQCYVRQIRIRALERAQEEILAELERLREQ